MWPCDLIPNLALIWPTQWHLSVTELLLATVLCLLSCLTICRLRHFYLWRRHGIPGPSPSLIFGNLLQLRTRDKDVLGVQTEWLQKYGKVCGYYIGYRPTLMVADLGILSQILIKDFPAFANRAKAAPGASSFTEPWHEELIGCPVSSTRTTAALEILWCRTSARCSLILVLKPQPVSPKYAVSHLMLPLMQDCVDDFMGVVSDYVDNGRDFDIFSLSQGFTLDVIGRCALAMRIDCQRNQQDPLLQLIRRFFKFAISPLVIMAMVAPALAPWLRCFRGTTTSALVEARVISNLNEVICRRRKTPGNSVDFLQLLIDASDEGVDDNSRLEMLDPSSLPPAQESWLPGTTSSSSLPPPSRSSLPTKDDHNCMVDTCCRLAKARTWSRPEERTSEGGAGDVRTLGGGGGGGDISLGSDTKVSVSADDTTGENTTSIAGGQGCRGSNEDRISRSRSQERPNSSSSSLGSSEDRPSRSRSQERSPTGTTISDNIEEPPTRPQNQERPPRKTNTSDNSEKTTGSYLPSGTTHLTDDEVMANAYMFVLAGYETTANAIAFTSYTLARYPQWQELCVEEIRKVMDGQEQNELTYEQVSCLHVLERVFQETLRIYPPVPSFVTREAGLTREVGGVTIPSGVNVTVPVWHIHHDPALWPDPEKFDPDRFLPEMKKGRPSLAWMPFGAGPRNCIGIRFARLEAKLALATLLRDYVIELAPCVKDPLPVGVQTVTLCPTEGVWLRARRRTQKQ
ncbi:LOW QUALITY PROTEIN: uncharacterized protein LOC125042480 [Penaeus chinensis]|uniref:LOW QUALITY PROTEIN: uncharacterized protein LOC125042480 n=1 Tax=Penaeus chinensis TaxID=139456 RepID=UPI001FB6BDB6|nr:LOW QUALITY PROTEIN: uncharacterized protein LOC125042480 [Penaeus chinensis]